jgi:hypothetical protein
MLRSSGCARAFWAKAAAKATAARSRAKPVDPALQPQLIARFDNYNQAIAAGKVQDALAIRTAETRTRAQKEMSTAKSRQEFLAMAKLMIPDKLEGGGL